MKTLCQFITCKVNYQNVGLTDVNEFVAISLEYPSGRELICYFSCILYWYGNLKEIVYLDPTVGDMRAYRPAATGTLIMRREEKGLII